MKQYDKVTLKDGRTGVIVEVFDDSCEVDVGNSPEDWETITVKKSEIVEEQKGGQRHGCGSDELGS